METVVIYPGRFHPFHKGHASVYNALVKQFGKDRVWIATSNKIDPPKSPFSFTEKRDMMALTGVDPSRVVQVVMPYIAKEITDKYDPENTILLFAVSDKDMAEDPRFQFKPKRDGSPSYYQPAQKDMRPMSEHGYIITVPTLDFNVLGQPMRSATEFRRNFAQADSDTQKAMMTDLFGRYDKRIHEIMAAKISEQLIRADEILEQLIQLGADDKYIVEACERIDMLQKRVLKESSRKSLYRAIMEGGHSVEDMPADDEYDPEGPDMQTQLMKIADSDDVKNPVRNVTTADGETVELSKAQADGLLNLLQMDTLKPEMKVMIRKNIENAAGLRRMIDFVEKNNLAEEITDFNKQDPMNSVIAIRGIGTMRIDQALDKIADMLTKMAEIARAKDARGVQTNMDYYMNLLNTYIPSVQEAYKELAAQRKRGGTASRGIDKDIEEGHSPHPKGSKKYKAHMAAMHAEAVDSKKLALTNVAPEFRNIVRQAMVKFPFAQDELTAVLHMMRDQMNNDKKQNSEIKRLDKENDMQDQEIDTIEKDVDKLELQK